LELAWDTRERQLVLRARSVRVVGRGGDETAEIPAVAVRLARAALLHGRIAPAEVTLFEPRLTVVRAPDGRLDLGVASGDPARREPLDLRAVVEGLSQGAGSGATAPSLRRLSAHGAEIAILDQGSGRTWRLAGADLVLESDAPGLAGVLAGRLEVAPHTVFLRAAAHYRPGRDHGPVTLAFRRLQPEMLGDLPIWSDDSAARRAVTALRMPLDGTLALTVDSGLRPLAARGHVRGGAGRVDVGSAIDPIDLTGLGLRGRLDVVARRLEVERLSLALGGPRVHVTGGVSWDEAGGVDVDARAGAERLPLDALGRWWPPGAAPGARRWVVERRTGGVFTTAQLELRASIEGESRKAAIQLRHGTARFDGVSIRYHQQLPPVTGVTGTVQLDDRGWTVHAARGRIGTIELAGASVALPVGKRRASRARVTAALRGPIPDALAILDREPFGYARALGIQPDAVTGAMAAHLAIDAPTSGSRPVAVSGAVHLTELATVSIIGGLPLGDGEASIDFEMGRFHATGTARIAGAPVTFDWSQDSTAARGPTRRATITARLDSENRRSLGYDLRPWLEGPVDVEARLATSPAGAGTLELDARLDDATIDPGLARLRKPSGIPGRAEAHLVLDGNAVSRAERLTLEAGPLTVTGRATAAETGGGWSDARLEATISGGRGTPPGRSTLTFWQQLTGYRFQLTSADAGTLLRASSGEDRLRGGRLVLDGTAEPTGRSLDVDARLDGRDAVLVGSPVLARIATLASFSGIERALSGKGVRFAELSAILRYHDPILTISDGLASGAALSIAIDGTIDGRAGTADMQGAATPSYYGLNTVPGRIPVLGGLAGGAEGVHAIDFTVSGPLADPRVRVEPASAFTPGALRGLRRRLGR
jgi:hypothetical protein